MVEIVTIETPTLGDRSYLVCDGDDAIVVDPQRDIDRVVDLAESRGVRVGHVFETHMHNDYVTGGRSLAAATGAAYHVNADDPVTFDRAPVRDGDVVDVTPSLSVEVLATPGHTFTHLSYALRSDGRVVAVFTGGSLLFGSVGRPDLVGPESTDQLARAQYASAQRLAAQLPDDADVLPTHGFGSFCSATQSSVTASTIGKERANNPALTRDEAAFVRELLAGLDAYPTYYARMSPANLSAPASPPDLSLPQRADAAELGRRIAAGEWVVDLRSRRAFAAGHLPGALSFGLDGSLATYLGWTIPWGTPVTLLGETPEQVAEAQRELVRIGIDRPAAAAVGSPSSWAGGRPLATMRFTDFGRLVKAREAGSAAVVVDVRRHGEWAASRLPYAMHIPLHELLGRLAEVPAGEVWVHCAAGYRAAIAGSLLAAAGRDVVVVDDDFANAPVSATT